MKFFLFFFFFFYANFSSLLYRFVGPFNGFCLCYRVIDGSIKNFKAFFRWLYVGKNMKENEKVRICHTFLSELINELR